MSGTRKVLTTILVLGLIGAIAGVGTYSAFSSTTSNAGNTYAAGTVYVADDDAGSAMYTVSNQKPGDVVTRCIRVTYTGTLPADVKLYTTSSINALGGYVDLTVDKGTMPGTTTFPNCTGFSSESTIFSNTLSGFAATATGYGSGLGAFPGVQTQWNNGDSVVYRFTLTLQDNNGANGGAAALTTGAHSFTWEANNQ
jgi:predicted ribosomally synthesized peptide with SipW-like signal peptide